ncbi:MAG: hypothetical protein JOZ47_08020 [Kutzneria sp.]|nr:hypothetical protein [Kutzneria sp.]
MTVSPEHEAIDPLAHGSNTLAFRRGRWVLLAQGVLLIALGCWALASGLRDGGDRGTLFVVFHITVVQAAVLLGWGVVTLACTLTRPAAATLACVQAMGFWVLFILASTIQDAGFWQVLLGYDPRDAFVYLILSVLGLVMVLWLFARALTDPNWPGSVSK